MADDHGPIGNSDEHCEAFYELPLCATLKIAVRGLWTMYRVKLTSLRHGKRNQKCMASEHF